MKPISYPVDMLVQNRRRLAEQLPPGSLAVVNSNDIMPTSADGTMPFRQASDMVYLTGMHQEETVLLFFPDAPDGEHKEVLFIREGTEQLVKWDGRRLSKQQAREATGIEKVYFTHEFETLFRKLVTDVEYIYLNHNEHKRASVEVETRDDRFRRWCQQHYPLHQYRRLAPVLGRLRVIKSEAEIELLKEAIRLTGDGLKRVARFLKPGVMEYELQAELAHEFMRQGSGFAGYSPIIASGVDATILHYIENAKACQAGEVVLLDFAAGHAGYHADLTRVLPVSGRFTDRQRQVYEACRFVFEAARGMMRPGALWKDIQKGTEEATAQACLGLGLYTHEELDQAEKGKEPWRRYFYHGVSHFLGLDVHDVGYFHEPMRAGMVFTCEPGIYIVEEAIGIRLENDILITETGYRDLMEEAYIPMKVEDIEAMMGN